MAARHYNLDEVMLIICGVPVTEYAEGDAIAIERNNPRFTIKDGHHGSTIYSKNPANSGTVTVKCMQGSPVNATLQAIADTDASTGLGTGIFEVKEPPGVIVTKEDDSWHALRDTWRSAGGTIT